MPDLIRRRRPDGVTQLFRRDERVQRAEWTIASFTTVLFTGGLFLCTAVPIELVGLVLLCWLVGEVWFTARALVLLRRPAAEVHVLGRRGPGAAASGR